MNKLIFVIFLAILWLIFVNYGNASQQVPSHNMINTESCPEGSYNIGISKTDEPLCRLEPTGCPYGDTLPMEDCTDPTATEKQPKLLGRSKLQVPPMVEGK